jgi:hypothetical protein
VRDSGGAEPHRFGDDGPGPPEKVGLDLSGGTEKLFLELWAEEEVQDWQQCALADALDEPSQVDNRLRVSSSASM